MLADTSSSLSSSTAAPDDGSSDAAVAAAAGGSSGSSSLAEQLSCCVVRRVEAHSKGGMSVMVAHPTAPLLATGSTSQVVKVWTDNGDVVSGCIRVCGGPPCGWVSKWVGAFGGGWACSGTNSVMVAHPRHRVHLTIGEGLDGQCGCGE
jgi:hypothetical protein